MSALSRAPRACGAIGSYDKGRLRQIAELLGEGLGPVHEDDSCALWLDREPLRWRGRRQLGLGWIEGDARQPPSQLPDWRAAAAVGICGLALDGRQRFLHSATNGLAPLYWTEQSGAVYFASRIDPLVRSSPARLSIDWDAWAAIIAMRYPLGERTPFAEIRRLPQESTLGRRLGRTRVKRERWAWSEQEPEASLATAAESIDVALGEALAPLPSGVVCPLSGGRDSRMLFLTLAREGKVATAVTVPDDEGDTHEEDLAAPMAGAFGVRHERLAGALADYPADWEERAQRVEYEFVDHAWLVPLSHRVAGLAAPVPDGFAIDVFLSVGRHFYTPETLDARNPRAASQALFETLRRYGQAQRALTESLQQPIVARAREQFLTVSRRFDGHPNQAFLSFYSTRALRGVSTYSTKLLGDRCQVVTPGATDSYARAALSLPGAAKDGGAFYRAVFERLAPTLAALPSTAEAPRQPPHLSRRWCSPVAAEAHRSSLLDGPLAPHLSPELRAWIEGPEDAEPTGDLRLGVESIHLLHSWWRRYREWLREVDPADLGG
jgi:hypothetical protein